MRRRLGLAAAAVLLLAATAAADEEIPLEVRPGSLVVEARINRRFTGRFLLDTGATYCVVGEDTARRARIKGRAGGKELRLLTANGPVSARLGEARKVELGGAAARDVAVAVMEEDPVHGLAGIVGLSFLQNFTYTVDTEAGVLRLED
jgi:clan AA aspartic protease (TIGR02281 family)